MHKRLVNYCTITLTLAPDGPILIKAGDEGDNFADPTKPKMVFVETYHQGGRSIYLPGSSLKGAIRAHAERIVRTVGSDRRDPNNPQLIWANDPLNDKYDYLEKRSTPETYKLSSFTDQLFGNTSIASRFRIEDAYPVDKTKLKVEERNGVAIDRVFGSVAVGPFNYQVCTAGEFRAKLHLKNFSLAQLGLIALVLRDLNDGWFGIGFAKSRGLGTVKVRYEEAIVQYPGCILRENQIHGFGLSEPFPNTVLLGAGEFLQGNGINPYGFPKPDRQETPVRATEMNLGFGVQLQWSGDGEAGIPDLFIRAVRAWSQCLQGGGSICAS